jgi:hypothetical protein
MRLILCFAAASLLAGAAYAKDHHKKHDSGPTLMPDPPGANNAPAPVPDNPHALNSLTLACSPPGADVYVDGELVSKAPIELPVPVKPGDHTLKVVKLGYAPYLDTFSTKGKKVVKLEVELVPIAGVLHVKSTVAESRVLVDGRFVGVAPVDVEIDVGARAIQVEKGCYKDFFKNVMAAAGKDEELDVTLESLPDAINPCYVKPLPPPKWYQKKWVWGVMGGAAAVVIAAVVVTAVVLGNPTDPLAGADQKFDLSMKGAAFFIGR